MMLITFKIFALLAVALTVSTSQPVTEIRSKADVLYVNDLILKYGKEMAELRKEMRGLQERVADIENVVMSEMTDVGSTEEYVSYHSRGSSTNKTRGKRATILVRRRVPEVSFQASLSQEYAMFKLYDAITFNDVITNIGGAYNKGTGVFTAPYFGTYSFHTNIVSEKGHYIEASIQVNERIIVSAISDHRVSSNIDHIDIWDQGNAVAIVSLRKGDKVSVTIQWPTGYHLIHGIDKSSFSGYLVRYHPQ